MSADPFAERLARVRSRFVATLESKVDDAYAAIAELSAQGPQGAMAVDAVYRSIHGICGVGPTVGFPATGRAAREVETVLRPAQHGRRALAADEVELFKTRLEALRGTIAEELRAFRAV